MTLPAVLKKKHVKTILAILGIAACLWGISVSWRAGFSRLLAVYARQTLSIDEANRAVELSPHDPEAYDARAHVLFNLGRIDESIADLERAVVLRPRSYFFWLELGRARDMNDDEAGALVALTEAVRLAPYYAEPRWQMGNVLYRTGRVEDGFSEMQRAARSDSKFWPLLIDLAWGTYKDDTQAIEQMVSPDTDDTRLLLARFFIKKGKTSEGLKLISSLKNFSDKERSGIINELITARKFSEAYNLWAAHPERKIDGDGRGRITNGSFEGRFNLRDTGFNWQQGSDISGVQVTLDTASPNDGAQSLLVEFNGNANPAPPVLRQLVLVEPDTRYVLSFAVRSKDLVTGGLPVVVVADASRSESPVLGRSQLLPLAETGWQNFAFEFTTSKTTEAVIINLQRDNCSSNPCPVFGRLWLDNFSLRKI